MEQIKTVKAINLSNERETARRLLTHYFRLMFEKTNTHFDWDNQSEIEEIINSIFDAIERVHDDIPVK